MTGTPVLPAEELAVTLTVDVPAGVPVAAPPPEFVAGVDESLPPQLSSPATASMITQPERRLKRPRPVPLRRMRKPAGNSTIGANRAANIVAGGPEGRDATGPPFVVMVRTVLMGPPAGVTLGGLKLQAAPGGRLPHAKLTG